MRKFLYATAALALIAASAAHADERGRTTAGAMVGGATGAATGAVIGGPVGAAVGGVVGAAIGAGSVPHHVRTYIVEHPVDSVRVQGRIERGDEIPDSVVIHEIPDSPDYGYVYVDHRPMVVRMNSRKVIYEGDMRDDVDSDTTAAVPDNGPPDEVITYVERHHSRPVTIDEGVRVGAVLPGTVELTPVPDDPDYAYVYTDDGPVLVRKQSRKVIWVH